MIRERELAGGEVHQLEIPHHQSRVLAKLHEVAEISEQHSGYRTTRITAWIPNSAMHHFAQFSVSDLQKRAKVG
jgi:hypothetical protein